MRKLGSATKSKCWKLEVVNQNEIIFEDEYPTLKDISNHLGITYNQVVELSSGRKKQPSGRYDTSYRFIKIGKIKQSVEEIKDNEEPECEDQNELEELDES